MDTFSLAQLARRTDRNLLQDYSTLLTRERFNTAVIVAHTAIIDERRLYLPAAYRSMFAYCIGEFRLSEDVAYRFIRAARVARRFPQVLPALAEGRLHLRAVVMLAPYLTESNAADLLAAAVHKSRTEIDLLLAERFPKPDLPTRIVRISPNPANVPVPQLAPELVGGASSVWVAVPEVGHRLTPELVDTAPCIAGEVPRPVPLAPEPVVHAPRATIRPLAPERHALRTTIRQSTRDNLQLAEELLGHQVRPGDLEEILDRAMAVYVRELQKQKYAQVERPRTGSRRRTQSQRHIPAEVKRAVWRRDAGQCTFVSENGKRCEARTPLEFDHVTEVARGGRATVDGIRLRCRQHNQHTAEQAFGKEFMEHKREEAKRAAGAAPSHGFVRERPRESHGIPVAHRERPPHGPATRSALPEPPHPH